MTESKSYCYHCGDDCNSDPIIFADKIFCCNGCKSVYQILNANTMHQYYSLGKMPGVKPGKRSTTRYKFLENEELAKKFFTFNEKDTRSVSLFLPDIHCVSCVWLLENLHLLNEGIIVSEVNFVKKEAAITFNHSKITLAELAFLLDKIGYAPIFDGDNKKQVNKVNKKFYLQLGVAIFCFGNIMLFSFPEYMNIDASYLEFRSFFSYLIFAISIPLLLFSAKDYWMSAFKGIRHGTVNLDVPITIGIMALYGRSTYDIFTHNGPGYMDSFAGFILFLLIGKWFQNKTYQALSFERDYKSYFPISVTIIENENESVLPLENLKVNDTILVKNGEIIPADAILMKGNANIDYSFVTGESKTISKNQGDEIFAGGKQMGDAIVLSIIKEVEQSYLTRLWNQKIFKKKSASGLKQLTDKLSKFFIYAVITVAVITSILWAFIDAENIVNVVTAVLIVACPCALALSVPFTFGSAMRSAGRNKLYLKNTDAVEQLGRVTDIVFDKTGTITYNEVANVQFSDTPLDAEMVSLICSLTRNSSHPLSKSIYQHLKPKTKHICPVENYTEQIGKGISGVIEGKRIKAGSASWVNTTSQSDNTSKVYISVNEIVIGVFAITNKYRREFISIIDKLKEKYQLHLISGDNNSEKQTLQAFFPDKQTIRFNQKPIDKLNYIKELQNQGKVVMMLGDGLNDAGALKQSNIGIVVSDDVYNFSPACDGIVDAIVLNKLPEFLDLGEMSVKILKRSYVFSLMYNSIGLIFAVSGFLTPLVAAILMPISSISVVSFSSLSVRYIEKKLFSLPKDTFLSDENHEKK